MQGLGCRVGIEGLRFGILGVGVWGVDGVYPLSSQQPGRTSMGRTEFSVEGSGLGILRLGL